MVRSTLAALVVWLVLPGQGRAQPLPCGPEFLVNSDTIGSHGGASVARAPDGGFLVAWGGTHGPGDDTNGLSIQARRYDAFGVPLGDQRQVNTYTLGQQFQPSLASTPTGFVVAWQDGAYGAYRAIVAQRLDGSGAPLGGEIPVSDHVVGSLCCPEVAADSSGGFVVTWASTGSPGDDADGLSVQGRRFAADGAPLGTQFQVNAYTTGAQTTPSVGRDASGGFVVAWTSIGYVGGDYSAIITARRYDALGAPAGGEFPVNAAPIPSAYGPAVAVDPDGAFVVAWSEQSDIRAARFDAAGQGVGGDFQVNSFTTSIQYSPVLARADDGSHAMVWTSWESAGSDQSFTNVQLRRLDAAGLPIGEDVQVNTSTAGRQEGPAITSLGGEDFVVAWSGYDHNEPSFQSRVWGQRFASTCVTTTTTSTSTTTLPTALLQGHILRLAPGKGKHADTLAARLVSHDPVVSAGRGAGSADDPTVHGGLVRIRSAAWGLDASHDLGEADWRRTRSGWRYAAGGDKVVVKDGKLLRLSLVVDGTSPSATDPTPVELSLRVGELRLCLAFQPGTAVMKHRAVVARDGAAPSGCLEP